MAVEQRDNAEARTFVRSGLSESAGLSRSAQDLFQPIDRASAGQQDLPWALDFGTGADLYQLPAYTGERLSASAFMADETEQKLDAPKIQPPSDSLARPSVIRTKEDEAIWDKMQEPHKLGKHESATHIGLSPEVIADMQKKRQASKLEFFDSAAEGALEALQKPASEKTLIASNITPNLPNLEQKQQYQDIQSDSKSPRIAQYSDGYMPPPTLLPDFVIQAGIQVWESSDKPLEGSEKKAMASTKAANPHAWEDASAAFPQLQGVSVDLMKAYTLNEIHNYDRNDWLDDLAAANGLLIDSPLRKAEDATLGLSQISQKGVHTFEDRYPQLRKFLEGKGYSGPGHEAKALLDPECVAMIVAAKTASVVEDMQKHGIKHPTNEQLAYAYNPDVYSYSEHGHKEYKALYQGEIYASKLQHWDQQKEYYANNPDVIAASKHIKNVLQCMQEL